MLLELNFFLVFFSFFTDFLILELIKKLDKISSKTNLL